MKLKNLLSTEENAKMRALIAQANQIVVVCHVHPDGDAIGSSLGWAEYLRQQGKQVTVIIPDMMPDFLQWLPNTEKIVRYDRRKDEADALIADADLIFGLDLNAFNRTELMAEAIGAARASKVIIDHHPNPDLSLDLVISHPLLSSTCELVFRVVWELGGFERMGKHFAVPVYCGIMTDTGAFAFNSSRAELFYIVAELLTKEIDKDKIYRNVYHNYSESRLRMMGYILNEKLEVDELKHVAFFALSKEEQKRFNFKKGDAEGIVNMPLQIKNLRLSISLREDTERENCIRVSLRSVDDFPCNKMSERYFNGGGHLNASGGKLECSLEEAIRIVRRAIQEIDQFL